MGYQLVTENVSLLQGPIPSTLQGTGAMISNGATNTTPGTLTLLTQPGDLIPILQGAFALASLSWSAGIVTATTVNPHGFGIGDQSELTIAGSTVSSGQGYNGSFLCTFTGASTFTYPLIPTPGTLTAPGVYSIEDVSELSAMVNTFFAQGSSLSCYVLEVGPYAPDSSVEFLQTWMAENPNTIYSYLVPRLWDGDPTFLAFLALFNSPTAKTYFWVTTTLATWQLYSNLTKCVAALIEAPPYGQWLGQPLTGISFSATWPTTVISAASWAATNGGEVTLTLASSIEISAGETITISGMTPAAYNGTFTTVQGTESATVVYALAADPGATTVLGALEASTTGTVEATTGANHGILPGQFFTLVGNSPIGYNGTFEALEGTAGETIYFAIETSPGAIVTLGSLLASQYSSAGIPDTEFSMAALFWRSLSYAPTSTNKVTPFGYQLVYGVTPFPIRGNSSLLTTLKANNISVIGTGAEGGISNTVIFWGRMLDGNPFTYWYAADYAQINLQLAMANANINGRNNPINPLALNQAGVNSLQSVGAQVLQNMVTFGLITGRVVSTTLDPDAYAQALNQGVFNGQAVINAVPFSTYYKQNAGQYRLGVYNGYSVVITPLLGFDGIAINILVSSFAA